MEVTDKKYIVILQALFAVLIYTVVQETMYYVIGFLLAFLKGSSLDSIQTIVEYMIKDGEKEFVSLLSLSIAGLICIPIYYNWYRYTIRFKKYINIKEALSYKNIIIYILLGISTNLFIASLIELFNITSLFTGYNDSVRMLVNGNVVLSTVLVVLIAPVCEELLNRGIVYEKIKIHTSVLLANILQAAVFALMHGNILQILYAFILGLLLGYIYEKYKSIYAPILIHLIFNATTKANGYIFSDAIISNNTVMVSICIISGTVLWIILKLIKYSPTIQYRKEPDFKMITLKELYKDNDQM